MNFGRYRQRQPIPVERSHMPSTDSTDSTDTPANKRAFLNITLLGAVKWLAYNFAVITAILGTGWNVTTRIQGLLNESRENYITLSKRMDEQETRSRMIMEFFGIPKTRLPNEADPGGGEL